MATTTIQAEKEAAIAKVEEQAVGMMYSQNINQAWHSSMVWYLEDICTTGNSIYPPSSGGKG